MDQETRRHFIAGIDLALIFLRAITVFLVGFVIAQGIRVVASILEAVQKARG